MCVSNRTESIPTDASDLQLIAEGARSNALLVGPVAATLGALATIRASLRPTIFEWPRDGAPWASRSVPGTVVLHDLALLRSADQERLLAWLQGPGSQAQVISLASSSILHLVAERRFLERLYYRLNILYVECP
jgi:hypothetical protein